MNDLTRVTPAQDFGQTLMDMLRNPKIPADKLQVMLQMQRELIAERRREAFQTAFVEMSAKMPQVKRDGTVELVTKDGRRSGSYKFTRWEDMDKVMRPILSEYGFALNFAQADNPNGGVTVIGTLMHRDGHSISSQRTLPPDTGPGRNALQAIGSSISYAKRYVAEGLCNIVRGGEDDDAISAYMRKVTDKQVKELERLIKETDTDLAYFLQIMVTEQISELSELPERDYARLINALNERKRRKK
jgi:succinate dehydrogenase flavin-adding protein (antitoxin of CptAB toxin-antitoxin module)